MGKLRTGEYIRCKNCQKEFYIQKCLLGIRKFCSKICKDKGIKIIAKEKNYGKWMIGREPKNKSRILNKICVVCKKSFSIREAQIINMNKSGRFCSRKCYWESLKNKRPLSLMYYKHNDIIKKKIGKKSKEMWNNPDFTNKRFEMMHQEGDIEKILKLFNENKMTLVQIKIKTQFAEGTIRRILLEKGIRSEDIRTNAKRMIGENTKKHRLFQILPTKDTSIEVKIQSFLKQLGIDFFTHQYMKIEHGYQCDIFIPSMNLVIECDGDYWHKYPTGREIDHIRTSELIQKGFKVLRLWEFEIRNMDLDRFKQRIVGLDSNQEN